MTLTEFLLARIAEDERTARATFGGLWGVARVLAECEARRRIVENCERALEACGLAPMSEQLAASDGPTAAYWRGQNWTLKVLAAVYADHSDYREEWKP